MKIEKQVEDAIADANTFTLRMTLRFIVLAQGLPDHVVRAGIQHMENIAWIKGQKHLVRGENK